MTPNAEAVAIPRTQNGSTVRRALHALTVTDGSVATALLRLTLGLVMLPHGAQKMLGWFGGAGFSGTVNMLTTYAGLPAPIAVLVVLFEFVGSIALILGAFSRLGALAIATVMVGAIATVHLPNGFFMNWTGTQAGEGFEYHLLAIGIAIAIAIKGGGTLSLDRKISRD
jgi:putative oxidoreductase